MNRHHVSDKESEPACEREAIRDIASAVAEVIRRMGATYGSAAEWRHDFRRMVEIAEAMNTKIGGGA